MPLSVKLREIRPLKPVGTGSVEATVQGAVEAAASSPQMLGAVEEVTKMRRVRGS